MSIKEKITDFISASANEKPVAAYNAFASVVEDKVQDLLTQKQDEILSNMFGEAKISEDEYYDEETLNEISPELRSRYADAARKSARKAQSAHMRSAPGGKAEKKHGDTMRKRAKGLRSVDVRRDAESGAKFNYMNPKDQKARTDAVSKRQRADLRDLSADEFKRRYRMTKDEFKRKNKR